MEPPALDRSALLAQTSLRGGEFCDAYTDLIDAWLAGVFASVFSGRSGVCLVATGGHGRHQLTPSSDLDLVLLHDGRLDVSEAQSLWYPIWDTRLKLGHAVRTVSDSLALASDDLATATSLLSCRTIAGDRDLGETLAERALATWRKSAKRNLATLAAAVSDRHRSSGDVAYDLEPDLKEGRGGLRDVHALGWALAADPDLGVTHPDVLAADEEAILAARVELHRESGRLGDRLALQEQDAVAARLDDENADVLMARLAAAARRIAWASDESWFDVSHLPSGRLLRSTPKPRDLGGGIALEAGRVRLVGDETPAPDAVLRVAVAAARERARIAPATIERLRNAAPIPEPWPREVRDLLVDLLGRGQAAIEVIEALDHADLWTRLLPEWLPNRSRPQRNAYHRYTVDRHLLECVAQAALLTDRVTRPDLLLVGALLHDIGKGTPGDHAVVGQDQAAVAATRFGFPPADVATIVAMVGLHLLLPDEATRRDLDDPVTIRTTVARVETVERLELLAALTEADSIATGPSAWGRWKAGLVDKLVARARYVLDGGDVADVIAPQPATHRELDLMARGLATRELVVDGDGDRLVIVCPDRPGLFSRVAGVLALNGLSVLDASVATVEGLMVDEFRVEWAFGDSIPWTKVERDLRRALIGRFALEPRLAERARSYRRPRISAYAFEPNVRVLDDASDDATVIEVFGSDDVGLLFRLARALTDLDLDIRRAKVSTIGAEVVDAFYVNDAFGNKLDKPDDLVEIRSALLHVLSLSPL